MLFHNSYSFRTKLLALISLSAVFLYVLPLVSGSAESFLARADGNAADEMAVMYDRRVSTIVGGLASTSSISNWLASLGPDGKWPDSEVDYTTGCAARRANWPAQEHWQRILVMAGAWHGGTANSSQWANNTELRTATGLAMSYWFRRDFGPNVACMDQGGNAACPCDNPKNTLWNTNWFSNVILIPKLTAQTCMLLKPSLTPTEAASCETKSKQTAFVPMGPLGNMAKTNANSTIIADTNTSKADLLAKSFFPKKPQETPSQNDPNYPTPATTMAIYVNAARVTEHIKKLSPHKAPGLDATIFTSALVMGYYYSGWRESITCVLRKPGKPSYELPKAYRPIALLSTTAKLLSSIVAEDMSRIIEQQDALPPNHYGGRPGRTTTDALHHLIGKIKTAWREGKVVSVLFLDVEGAFPNAVTKRVIHNLKKRSIPTQYVKLIEKMLNGRKTKLKFDDFLSEYIDIDNGIGQGCPLSMIIYILYNADLLEIPEGNDEDAIGYVDDAIFIAIGDNFEETTAKLKHMMERPKGGLEWSRKHNSRFEMSKVAVMHLTRKTTTNEENQTVNLRTEAPPLVIQEHTITVAEEYKYLGVLIDPELRWKKQAHKAVAKATAWVTMFKRLARPFRGMRSTLMRHLYRAVAIPKLTYALDIWYEPPSRAEGRRNSAGSVAATTQMARVQRMAALAITGAMRTTATDVLDLHAGLYPIAITLKTICERAYLRLCTLPDSHPLSLQILAAFKARQRKLRHPTPIIKLAKLFQHDPGKIEKIGMKKRAPDHIPTFNTQIQTTRRNSIAHEQEDDAPLKIYTDGSGIDKKTGAAALLYTGKSSNPTKTLRYHLGSITEHSTYEAEWVGAIMALWILHTTAKQEVGQIPISVYTDNQGVIMALRAGKPGPGQYLQDEFIRLADALRNRGENKIKFTLKWISAHSQVARNERVDEEAKKAAQGDVTFRMDLPPLLRKKLPRSKSAVKQEIKKRADEAWASSWEASPRKAKYDLLDQEFPFTTYRKISQNLPRTHATVLTQIRTGHVPLNGFLNKIGLSPTDTCQKCKMNKRETIDHFLFECPAYRKLRSKMDKSHGQSKHILKEILSDEAKTAALIQYVIRTKRFKTQGQPYEQNQNHDERTVDPSSNAALELEIAAGGTQYAAGTGSRTAFETLFQGHKWMIYANSVTNVLHFDFSVIGRMITWPVIDGQASADIQMNLTTILELGRLWSSTPLIDFATQLMENSPNANAGNLRGNNMFYTNDYMVHRGSNFVSTLRMYSKRTLNSECVNIQNTKGFHLSDGTLYTYVEGDEYEDIAAAWDWDLIPGTTVDYQHTPLNCSNLLFTGVESFVGGLSDGTSGIAVMRYTNPSTGSLKWQKTWFFLGSDVIHVMVNILTSNSNAPVYSILDQKRLSGQTFVNGVSASAHTTSFTNPSSIWHDNVGYSFPTGSNSSPTALQLTRGQKTGDWAVIGTSSQPPVTVNLWAAWLEHKNLDSPTEYSIWPGVGQLAFQGKAVQSPVETIENSKNISAIYNRQDDRVMLAFWGARGGSLVVQRAPALAPLTITSPIAVVIMMSFQDGAVVASDPSQSLQGAPITFAFGPGVLPTFWKGSRTKTLQIAFPAGGLAGNSVKAQL